MGPTGLLPSQARQVPCLVPAACLHRPAWVSVPCHCRRRRSALLPMGDSFGAPALVQGWQDFEYLDLARGENILGISASRPQKGMPSADESLCEPDVLTTSKFRAWDRHAGGKCGSQLRVVHLAPYESVIVGRQAFPQAVLLRKISQQLLQFGNRKVSVT